MWDMSATALVQHYANGTLSPVTVMKALLERCDEINPKINALYEIQAEAALEAAEASEARWKAGAPVGPLDGVPCVVKDSFAVKGMVMLRGLKARHDAAPDATDCPPVARLREAGAIIFAKSTMPDMGFLGAGVNSINGVTRNPWDLSLNTGGSSAGSAAAVAAGLAPVSVGSDVGGSVRLPATHCGLFALKPTAGAVPHLPYSRDRAAGPITRTVADAILMMSILGQPDSEAFEKGMVIPATLEPADLKGKRVGLMLSIGDSAPPEEEVEALIRQAAHVFESLGATVVEMENPVPFPFLDQLTAYFSVKAASERAGLPAERRGDMLPILTRCCDAGDAMSARDFAKALSTVEKAQVAVNRATDAFDLVLAPTMPVANYPAENTSADPDYPHRGVGFTALFNQSGQPAATVACGFVGTSPVGLQVIGAKGSDIEVLRACLAYETARGPLRSFPETVGE